MQSRILHIFCLMFVSLWFGVIAPGHTRGTIKLPGSDSCETTSTRQSKQSKPASCCPTPAADPSKEGDGESHPPQDPASCCAVCYLNSVLDTPEKPVFVTFCTGMLTELEPIEPIGLSSILVHLLAHIRGPPALAY